MLLIDGVKYELWTPPNEDEFERVVKEHTQYIFGEQSIYLDRKQKLKSLSGIGSIPDGYAIILGDAPQWHIVEVELSSHPLHDHIVSQLGRFISGISNPNIPKGIVNAIDEEINRDDFLKLKLRKAIEPAEIYKFLTELISKQPILTIVIEKDTEEVREALNTLRHPEIRVVEFQTFTREGVGLAVHAHLFEPLYKPSPPQSKPEKSTPSGDKVEIELDIANCIKYHYIPLYDDEEVSFFPDPKIPFIFETNLGDINTNVAGGGTTKSIPYIHRNLKRWFEAHPQVRKGDGVRITVIDPMKKYHLEIVK